MSKHTKFQLEKFKLELHNYELNIIEDALEAYCETLPADSERSKSCTKIIKKLYSNAWN